MQNEDTKITDNLDHNIPEFIDPDESEEIKEEYVGRRTDVEFVPIIRRKPSKKVIILNTIKMIVWCILAPFCVNTGIVYYFTQDYVKDLEYKEIGLFLLIFFAAHIIAAFWIDWITGRKKH